MKNYQFCSKANLLPESSSSAVQIAMLKFFIVNVALKHRLVLFKLFLYTLIHFTFVSVAVCFFKINQISFFVMFLGLLQLNIKSFNFKIITKSFSKKLCLTFSFYQNTILNVLN